MGHSYDIKKESTATASAALRGQATGSHATTLSERFLSFMRQGMPQGFDAWMSHKLPQPWASLKTAGDPPGVRASKVSKVAEGQSQKAGAIYCCIDTSYAGTGGVATLKAELARALAKTDYGKFYKLEYIDMKRLATDSTLSRPPNMCILIHGDLEAADQNWKSAGGDKANLPAWVSRGNAPNLWCQPVEVGRSCMSMYKSNPKIVAYTACHELGHRLFNLTDGLEKGMKGVDGHRDNAGGWGDWDNGTDLMTMSEIMLPKLITHLKKGEDIPDRYYKFDERFLKGYGEQPGITRYFAERLWEKYNAYDPKSGHYGSF